MEGLPVLHTIGEVLLFLGKLVFITASGIALYRNRSTAAKIMLAGSISILIADALGIFLITNAALSGPEKVVTYSGINSIIQATTFIIFGLGLLLYILTSKNRK